MEAAEDAATPNVDSYWKRSRTQLLWHKQRIQERFCTDIGNNVFYYGHKAAADHMRTSWEKLVQHIGTKYGQNISNDLDKKIKVNIVTPVHSTEVL